MDYIIETQNIVKQFAGKFAVDKVSLHVERGDIYGLIGKNGAGKTTLMKLLLGLLNPNSGSISLFGSSDLNAGRQKIGSLIEAPGLYKNCTAYENMLRFSILYGADKSEIKSLLEKVGLSNTGNKKAGEFSLGMKQRLGIAIALLNKPEVLILDEPINGLDPAGIKEIRDTIFALNKEGITFMISSHILDELQKVTTKYGIIADGQLLEEISAKDLLSRSQQYVKFKINNAPLSDVDALLRAKYPNIKTEIQDGELHLLSNFDDVADINSMLVEIGVKISEISVKGSNFEDYFIERLGK